MKFPRTGYPIFQLVPYDRFRSVTRDRSVRATLAKRRKREGEKESSDIGASRRKGAAKKKPETR